MSENMTVILTVLGTGAAIVGVLWRMGKSLAAVVDLKIDNLAGDLKETRGDVANLRNDLHAMDKRLVRIETRLEMPLERPTSPRDDAHSAA